MNPDSDGELRVFSDGRVTNDVQGQACFWLWVLNGVGLPRLSSGVPEHAVETYSISHTDVRVFLCITLLFLTLIQ